MTISFFLPKCHSVLTEKAFGAFVLADSSFSKLLSASHILGSPHVMLHFWHVKIITQANPNCLTPALQICFLSLTTITTYQAYQPHPMASSSKPSSSIGTSTRIRMCWHSCLHARGSDPACLPGNARVFLPLSDTYVKHIRSLADHPNCTTTCPGYKLSHPGPRGDLPYPTPLYPTNDQFREWTPLLLAGGGTAWKKLAITVQNMLLKLDEEETELLGSNKSAPHHVADQPEDVVMQELPDPPKRSDEPAPPSKRIRMGFA